MDIIINDREEIKNIISNFLQIIDRLDIITKAEVISKISESIKKDKKREDSYYFFEAEDIHPENLSKEERMKYFMDAFGGWESEETADELIENIRSSQII
ncbi:MAG: hypothetical protein H7A25_10605 [Leptospiraceae bacterium]|nr:hypothetical protein [Leptospiraceae bacterium]MCP5500344.1 hypothetical protein [Leptospiraceae bacterium]